MSRSGFWSEDCPGRGAGLSHAHWDKCTPEAHPGEEGGHLAFQCCHCRALNPAAKATTSWPPRRDQQPPLDVQQRLRALGIMTWWHPQPDGSYVRSEPPHEQDTGMEDIRAEHTDSTPVEPRMVTGEGATGPYWGPGRFHMPDESLTERDKMRIRAFTGWGKAQAAHDDRDWHAEQEVGERD